MQPKTIKTVLVKFDNGLSDIEIPYFRGAMIHSNQCSTVLFHNHIEDKFRYAYPLIQYRIVEKKAAVYFVDEAISEIGKFLLNCEQYVSIGKRKAFFKISNIEFNSTDCGIGNDLHLYSIQNYLPLNQENYQKYLTLKSQEEKNQLLEHCLCGNILSFGKSLGLFFEEQVLVKIIKNETPRNIMYKGVSMLSFDIQFVSNVQLPSGIGLGKGVSIGKGITELIGMS